MTSTLDAFNRKKGDEMISKNNQGFSLIELSIALGLMVVLIGVVSAGSGMMTRTRETREARTVEALHLAAQNYLSGQNLTYGGISVAALKEAGLLPSTFEPGASNSFGGDYAVSANTEDATRVDIVLNNIPDAAGEHLSGIFKGKAEAIAYDKGAKIWKATF